MTLGIIAGDVELRAWYKRQGFTVTETKAYDDVPFEVTFLAIDLGP